MQSAMYTLRAVDRREEVEPRIDFYNSNPAPFLLPRPAVDFEKAIERGQHFIVELDNTILAASGIFDYGNGSGPGEYVEFSETLVLPKLQGFGLQRLFFRLRLASMISSQGPSIRATTAIDQGNRASVSSTLDLGFELWLNPIPEAYESCPTCPHKPKDQKCCCNFYQLPLEKAKVAISEMLTESATRKIKLRNRHNDEITLDSARCQAITRDDSRRALADFVSGNTW